MSQSTIGIDISKDHLDVWRQSDGAERRFTNDKAGHKALLRWIGDPGTRVIYEATGSYHRAMELALNAQGQPLVKVNPRQARRFCEATGTLAKTDRVDARLLGMMGTALDLKPRPIADEQLGELRDLLQARRSLVRDRTAAKNRLHMLTVNLLKRQRRAALRQIEAQIAQIDTAVAEIIKADPELKRRFDILLSIPGIAEITAFALLIDMPELGGLDARAAASLAGVSPRTRQSGKWQGRAFVWGGRKTVRDALYMPALVATRFNPDLKATYNRLTAAGKAPKLAITAIMRKLIVLANTLLRDNQIWTKNAV